MLVFLSFERCLATAFSSLKSPAHGFRGEIGVFGLCNLKATITSFHPLNAAIPFVKPSSCLAGSFVFSYKLKSNALCSSASPSIPSSTPNHLQRRQQTINRGTLPGSKNYRVS